MNGKLKTALGFALAGLVVGGAIAVLLAGLVIGAIIGIGLALFAGLLTYWRVRDASARSSIEDKR